MVKTSYSLFLLMILALKAFAYIQTSATIIHCYKYSQQLRVTLANMHHDSLNRVTSDRLFFIIVQITDLEKTYI